MKQSLKLLAVALLFLALGFLLARMISVPADQPSTETPSEDFSAFINDFHDNPVFQKQRTRFPLMYITPSQQEESAVDTFLIESAQWTPLVVLDTMGTLMTISPHFCGDEGPSACQYSVTFQGINHGEQTKFLFENNHGQWRLFAFEDFSM